MTLTWELMCRNLSGNLKRGPGIGEAIADAIVKESVGIITHRQVYEKLTQRLEDESTPARVLLRDQMEARQANAYANKWGKK